MTRKKFRKDKRNRELQKKTQDPSLDKPIDADPEAVEAEFQNWKKSFLAQFSWHPSYAGT